MRRYLPVLPLLVVAAVLAADHAMQGPALQISYEGVTEGAVTREVLTSGTLEPAGVVNTGTQVSGTIQSLDADFNTRVKTGQIIATLDPAAYDSRLAEARAQLLQSESETERTRLVADDTAVKAARARELAAQDLIAKTELDAAELAAKQGSAQFAAARAEAKAAAAQVAQAQITRDRTIIRAPIDGIVVSRNVEIGQTLAASIESPVLFRIADLRRMHLLAEISEAEVGGVEAGTPVTFEIESIGAQQFRGTVSEVRLQPVQQSAAVGTSGSTAAAPARSASPASGASTQPQTGSAQAAPTTPPTAPAGSVVSYVAIVDVDNSDGRIAPGSTAIVTLPTAARSDAIRIPNNALTFRPSPAVLDAAGQKSLRVAPATADPDAATGRRAYVWKYEKERFVPVEVRTGVSDERWTELLSGPLKPGDRLVTSAIEARRTREPVNP